MPEDPSIYSYSPEKQPIEHLAERVRLGEIELEYGLVLAIQPAVTAALNVEYSQAVAGLIFHLATEGNVRSALLIANLLRVAVEALPDQAQTSAVRVPGELAWIRAVIAVLPEQPDWHLYRSAGAVGVRLLRRAQACGDQQLERRAHSELGELHFQPLVTLLSSVTAWPAITRAWYERGNQTSGNTKPYPQPVTTFARALSHFRRAERSGPDSERAMALKGQIQALDWLGRVRGESRVEEMAEIAAVALPLIDQRNDLAGVTYLMHIRLNAGQPLDADLVKRTLSMPVEELIQRSGPNDTVTAYLNLARLLATIDARQALTAIDRATTAVAQVQNENILARYFNGLIGTLILTMFNGTVDNSAGTLAAAHEVRRRAETEKWSLEKAAGALMALVEKCSARNEEIEGLQLLEAAEKLYPDPFNTYPAAMHFWKMALWSGEGVNNANAGHLREALASYAQALREALQLGFRELALPQLKYLVDVGIRGADKLLLELLAVLFDIGLELEIVLGAEGVDQLQELTAYLTDWQLTQGTINSNLLHFTWQVAKARRFGAALRTGAALRLEADSTSDALLARINALRTEVSLVDEGTGPGSRLDRTLRLLTFVNDDTPAPGSTALEQMTNLQHRFDQRLERRLAQVSAMRESDLFGIEDLRSQLDTRTALLQIYLGTFDEKQAVVAILAAREGVWVTVTPGEQAAKAAMVEFVEAGHRSRAYSYVRHVYNVRSALMDESSDDKALGEALHAAGGTFLHGKLGDALDKLRDSGCNHLLIVPHGPFHFAPLHLFARGKRLLAEEWMVSVLPSIELIRRHSNEAVPDRRGVAAFGVSFTKNNIYSLPVLKDAVDEAQRIAKALGAIAFIDDDVTEEALLQRSLPQALYLHLATHGAMNLDAPAFQYVVVTPSAESDGLLHAHELLRQDLRGLRLVTLSACETALGRIDRADNPRGLPAALLLAGAESIVGTLWEVSSDPARAFFVELYRAIAAGQSRRDAFRKAQLDVRKRFPHPRDWGAFYLLGAWD